jgi:hypothetical protein
MTRAGAWPLRDAGVRILCSNVPHAATQVCTGGLLLCFDWKRQAKGVRQEQSADLVSACSRTLVHGQVTRIRKSLLEVNTASEIIRVFSSHTIRVECLLDQLDTSAAKPTFACPS